MRRHAKQNPAKAINPADFGFKRRFFEMTATWEKMGIQAVIDLVAMGAKIPLPLFVLMQQQEELEKLTPGDPKVKRGEYPKVDVTAWYDSVDGPPRRVRYSIWLSSAFYLTSKRVAARWIEAGLNPELGNDTPDLDRAYVHYGEF